MQSIFKEIICFHTTERHSFVKNDAIFTKVSDSVPLGCSENTKVQWNYRLEPSPTATETVGRENFSIVLRKFIRTYQRVFATAFQQSVRAAAQTASRGEPSSGNSYNAFLMVELGTRHQRYTSLTFSDLK